MFDFIAHTEQHNALPPHERRALVPIHGVLLPIVGFSLQAHSITPDAAEHSFTVSTRIDARTFPGIGVRSLFKTTLYVTLTAAGEVRRVEVSTPEAADPQQVEAGGYRNPWVSVPAERYGRGKGAARYTGKARDILGAVEAWVSTPAALPWLRVLAQAGAQAQAKRAESAAKDAVSYGRDAGDATKTEQQRAYAERMVQAHADTQRMAREVEAFLLGLVAALPAGEATDPAERERVEAEIAKQREQAERERVEREQRLADASKRRAEAEEKARQQRIAKERLEAAAPALLDALEQCVTLIDQMMPGVRHIALQNYALLNNAPVAARAAIRAAKEG